MKRRRGFTLLEVLVAIAILGLALTVILSSQVGLFSSARRTENLTFAVNLARCKMNEAELRLLKEGYPLIDQTEEGPCCEDEVDRNYSCEWKVETVTLPEPQDLATLGDGGADLDTGGGLGPMGALAEVQQSGGKALGDNADVSDLAGMMSGAAAGGSQAMAPLVMGMVYPDLKPMLEASIRKVTVIVRWKEGSNRRDFQVTQYVTNPQQGGLDPNQQGLGVPGAASGLIPGAPGGITGPGSTGNPGGGR